MAPAIALVRSVFPRMSPFEHLSFIAIRNPQSLAGRLLLFLGGIKDILAFDVLVDEAGAVLGTTGLYRYQKDAQEAVWLSWFCVAPQARGQGLGQALLAHTVAKAQKAGFNTIRLYTSTDPNEAAAQRLYEKNGFHIVKRCPGVGGTILFRERQLEPRDSAQTSSSS